MESCTHLDRMKDLQRIDDYTILFDFPPKDLHFALLMYQIPTIGDFFSAILQVLLHDTFDLGDDHSRRQSFDKQRRSV